MKAIVKTTAFSILVVIFLFSGFSCTQSSENTVAQTEYDGVKAQLSAAEARITDLEATLKGPTSEPREHILKDEIASLKTNIEELGKEITDLSKQNDSLTAEKAAADAQYAELNIKYQNLQKQLSAPVLPEVITEDKIEKEILGMINQERVQTGVPELLFGNHLYNQAKQNSKNMAVASAIVTDQAVFYQEIFWAGAYDSVSSIARGALITWKVNVYKWEHGALLVNNKYGAVGAYKSGDIIFITFMAAEFP